MDRCDFPGCDNPGRHEGVADLGTKRVMLCDEHYLRAYEIPCTEET